MEWLVSDPRQGDVTQRVEFEDYRSVDGLMISHRLRFAVGTETAATWTLATVALPDALDDGVFASPEGLEATVYPPSFRPERVGEGVFALRLYSGPSNSYTSLLVELDDAFLVVEPILSDVFVPAVRQIARQIAPGKPIKWVVATHHHSDHIGGARGHLRGGAKIITTPDGRVVLRDMAASSTSLGVNPVSGRSISGDIIEVEDRFSVGDDDRRVDIFRLSPTGHAEQMLLVHVLHAGVIYVADLYAVPESGIYKANDLTVALGDAIQEFGLDVEAIVPTHGLPGTYSQLLQALADIKKERGGK